MNEELFNAIKRPDQEADRSASGKHDLPPYLRYQLDY